MRLLHLLIPLLAIACGGDEHAGHEEHAGQEEQHGGHENDARYGGVMVEIGEHAAWVELVHDAAQGTLTAYVWDAHAENPVRLEANALTVRVGAAGPWLELAPVGDDLTGETPGDTSRFEARDERLRGLDGFAGALGPLKIRGMDFSETAFTLPGGARGEG